MCECPKCGSEHDSEAGMKIHYGRAHEGSISGVKVECNACGDTFRKQRSHAEEFDRHYCSNECKSEGYDERVELTCDKCGESFLRRQSHLEDGKRNFCSVKCKTDSYKRRVETECDNCGDTIEKTKDRYERYDNHYCNDECRTEHMRGMADPKWKGGATLHEVMLRSLSDGSGKWRALRREIKERREVKCKMCGREQSRNDRDLQVHHIVPLTAGGSNHADNLMLLCHRCHRSVESYTDKIVDYTIKNLAREFAE